jgi:uncharacterized membrane protein YcaP (DUF421 family)
MTTFADAVNTIWGNTTSGESLAAGQVVIRSLVVFLAGLFLIRVGKSRLFSQASSLDVLIGVILGSLLSRAITGSAPFFDTLIACATLVAVHWLFSALAFRFHAWGDLVKGHAHQLVSDGHILWDNMRKSHISEHDLLEELRLGANIDDLSQVQSAFKERSGRVGIVKRPTQLQVLEINVQDGVQTIRVEISHRS